MCFSYTNLYGGLTYRAKNKNLNEKKQINYQTELLLPSGTLVEFYLNQRHYFSNTMAMDTAVDATMVVSCRHRLAQESHIKTFYHANQYAFFTMPHQSDAQETRRRRKSNTPQHLISNTTNIRSSEPHINIITETHCQKLNLGD